MRNAISTSFANPFVSSTSSSPIEAPSTLRTPISLVRCAVVMEVNPNSPKQAITIANAAMLDFEDSMKPTWDNVLAGHANLRLAARGTLTFDKRSAEGELLAGPVDVLVPDQARDGVVAVPTRALLALAEGGQGVEIIGNDGTTRLVGVETGLFADGWVEIVSDTGDGVIVAGTSVVVPR